MIVRRYAGVPVSFMPDRGEVVLARKSPAAELRQAVITHVSKRGADRWRFDWVWYPAEEGEEPQNVYVSRANWHVHFKRLPKGAPAPEGGGGADG